MRTSAEHCNLGRDNCTHQYSLGLSCWEGLCREELSVFVASRATSG